MMPVPIPERGHPFRESPGLRFRGRLTNLASNEVLVEALGSAPRVVVDKVKLFL
jgi:hypothetical protein